MSLSARIIPLVVTSLVTLLIAGCSGSSQRTNSDVATLEERLEPGDLIFRRGTGVVGHIVTSVDNSGEYSHVGIAVLKDKEWCVVHAVPHEPDFEGDIDRVKCEALESFVGRYRDGAVATIVCVPSQN